LDFVSFSDKMPETPLILGERQGRGKQNGRRVLDNPTALDTDGLAVLGAIMAQTDFDARIADARRHCAEKSAILQRNDLRPGDRHMAAIQLSTWEAELRRLMESRDRELVK
jgi:hypothetical protein